MARNLALALALLAVSLGAAAAVGPDDFPPGCGVLTVVRDGETNCKSLADASDQTVEQLQGRNPGLDCATLKAGDLVCTADELGFCANKATISAGQTCADISAANGLSLNQLLGLNQQLSTSQCADLGAGDVCLPSLPPEASCGGLEYPVVAGDTCASIAGKFGMSCAQVKALNPKSFADDGSAYEGLTLCIGCPPQPTCGLNVSPSLSAVLNANLQLCGVFRTCEGDFTLNGSGLTTLTLEIPQPGEDPSTIRVTPGVFADGSAMVQLVDVAPQLLSLDLFKLLGGLLDVTTGGGGGGGGSSARVVGLEINLLNGKPLLGASKTSFLGIFGRRLQASWRQARRLLGNNGWTPKMVRPSGYTRYPRLTYQ